MKREVVKTFRRYIFLSLITALWISPGLISCGKSQTDSQAAIQQIDAQEAYKLVQEHPDVLFIDVRTPGEYTGELGHAPGARLMPLQQIEDWAQQLDSLKEDTLVLICRSGNRSMVAANYLKEKGFKHLFNVKGGMRAWNQAKLPVEK